VSVLDGVARGAGGVHAGDPRASDPVVRAFTAAGVLRLRRDGRYEPGLTLLLWSRLLNREATPDSIGSEVLRPVIEELGETAAVVVLDPVDGTARYGEPVESAQPIQYLVPPRTAVPLHAGAAGRAILAAADDAVRAGVELTSLADDSITDPNEIEGSLAEIRRVGYAVSSQEWVADAAAVAAPSFADGRVHGSLTTMIPLYRLKRLDLVHHGQVLRAAADRLSGLLSLTAY
jgi:DNA-binding IclR family transcriptional regulator